MTYTPGADFASGNVKFNAIDLNFNFIAGLTLIGAGGVDSLTVNEPTAGSNDTIYFAPGPFNNGSFQFTTQNGGPETAVVYSPVVLQSIETRNFMTGTGNDTLSISTDDLPGVNSNVRVEGGAVTTRALFGDQFADFSPDPDGNDLLTLEFGTVVDDVTVLPAPHVAIAVNTGVGTNRLNYVTKSASDEVTVDLASQTVKQPGFGDVSFTSVQRLDVQGNSPTVAANRLTIDGTALDDQFTLTSSAVSTAAGQVEFASPAALRGICC